MSEPVEGTRGQTPDDIRRVAPVPTFETGETVPGLSSWVLERRLGKGGFGEVWLAKHAWDKEQKPRAVKFCTDPAARHRLVTHEKNVVLRVMKYAGKHPNIVPLLDCNLDGEIPWLMYEFVEGGTLVGLIKQSSESPPSQRIGSAIRTLHGLASALAQCHRLAPPLVHRDIKPHNVLMAGDTPRITDFGIGGVAQPNDDATRSDTVAAARLPTGLRYHRSAGYAPPERDFGSPPHPHDDVYALGVIAFQMLTGDLTASPGADATLELRELKIQDGLASLIVNSVAMNPDRRPKDAAEWEAVIAPLLSKSPSPTTRSQPPSPAPNSEPPRTTHSQSVSPGPRRSSVLARLFGGWLTTRSHPVSTETRKCPRCFDERLVASQNRPEDEDRPWYHAKGRAKGNVPTETTYVECTSCSFRFLRSYQKLRHLYFPTVGVPASGMTSTLTAAYDRIRKGVVPVAAMVEPVPSLGNSRFEQYVDLFINQKCDVGGTVHDMPDPVMLHVRDTDPDRSNIVLANLFDYSGALVNQSITRDRLKKQAVQMDGFMLFLDPTQVDGSGANLTLERQLAALNEFMADMREVRKVPLGQVIPTPVAVCIPKFDLLLTDNPIQGQCVPFIRRMLSELNPPPRQTTLDTIRRRDDLVEEMLPLLFRGVNIRVLVERYFGSQVMLFPISSVSLFEAEFGIKDLSKRTLAPFGVAEPFLWLLHMHGYKMFAEDGRQR